MDIDTTLQKFEHFGVKLGLESIQHLLAKLGNPHQSVPIIHVAGSNGKGSVCAYLATVLTEARYRVGRYTSPHLVDWTERICVNGQPISATELEQTLQQILAVIQPDEPSPTQFEVITAAAWLYFAQQKVDIAVIEVGLGGRLDATNVCDRPLVSVITSISREHWQRLGPTLADIAGEKAGILKPDCPAVVGQLPLEAMAVVNRRITDLNCPTIYPQPAKDLGNGWAEYQGVTSADLNESATNQQVIHTGQALQYQISLQGAIQLHNAALAIAALQVLQQQGWKLLDETIARGIAKTTWTGRLQWFTWQNHKILIDGAHNPASAEVLRQFIDSLPAQNFADQNQTEVFIPSTSYPLPPTLYTPSTHWVMGMLSTKDHADVFKALLKPGDRLYLVPVPDHSSADPDALAQLATNVCPALASCQTYLDVFTALEAATDDEGQAWTTHETTGDRSRPLTVLCGSLYLIGHFLKVTSLPDQPTMT